MIIGTIIISVILALFFYGKNKKNKKKSIEFIKSYKFPNDTVIADFKKLYPDLSPLELEQVINSLKQFFIAKVITKCTLLMPSKIADDLWHCHIKNFEEYIQFCKQAFGKPLNHFPLSVETEKYQLEKLNNFPDKILNTYSACKIAQNTTDPTQAIPILFLIDHMLNIDYGFHYTTEVILKIEQQIVEKNKSSHSSDSSSDSPTCGDDSGNSSCSSCGGD